MYLFYRRKCRSNKLHILLFFNCVNLIILQKLCCVIKFQNITLGAQQVKCFTRESEALFFSKILMFIHLIHLIKYILYIQITLNVTIWEYYFTQSKFQHYSKFWKWFMKKYVKCTEKDIIDMAYLTTISIETRHWQKQPSCISRHKFECYLQFCKRLTCFLFSKIVGKITKST